MKPIIKWPGGKRAVLQHFEDLIRNNLNSDTTFYEPFAGGLAVSLSLEHPKTVVNDLNSELINMYTVVRDEPEKLIRFLEAHQADHSEEHYYKVRDMDRCPTFAVMPTYVRAARTIYLNKTCFNGLYRVNSKGYFNSPIGRTTSGKTPDIVQEDAILELSKFLKTVDIRCGDYRNCLVDAKANDVVYLDSPYNYENEDGFTAYQKEGWTNNSLVELKQCCDELVDKGVKVIISNNSIPFVRNLFNDDRYDYFEIDVKRSINSNKDGRGPVKEIVIYSKNCK